MGVGAPGGLKWQPTLFGDGEPAVDVGFATAGRVDLDDESWVEHVPGWVRGADALFADVLARAPWEAHERWMYERKVADPRLTARGWDAYPPVVETARRALSDRYGVQFTSVGFNLYRDGRDSVAWHGDRVARDLPAALVAIVSLGGRRPFLLRPRGGGRSRRFDVDSGDLLVMGGACQRRWDHSVPKRAAADARISIQFRHKARILHLMQDWEAGKWPEQGIWRSRVLGSRTPGSGR